MFTLFGSVTKIDIEKLIIHECDCDKPCETPEDKSSFDILFIINNIKIQGGISMVQLSNVQQVSFTLKPKDKKGDDAQVQTGSVVVTSSNEEVVKVVMDPNSELSGKLVAVRAGVAQVDFSADADLGEGVVTISTFTGVEVTSSQAQGFGVEFGAVEDQPADAPAAEAQG